MFKIRHKSQKYYNIYSVYPSVMDRESAGISTLFIWRACFGAEPFAKFAFDKKYVFEPPRLRKFLNSSISFIFRFCV